MTKPQGIHYLKTGQQGSVLIIMVLILIVGVAAVMLSGISGIVRRPAVEMDTVTRQSLVVAKEGLITWAAMRGISNNENVPPGLLPYPDRSATSESPRNYDGISDCPPPNISIASNLWRLGKLPVLGENGPCRSSDGTVPDTALKILDSRDSAGETIWYAVSRNLLDDRSTGSALPAIRPSFRTLPANWLTVCDQNGNLLSDRVAFVVIAPGAPLAGQTRPTPPAPVPAPAASNYLDRFSLPAAGNPACRSTTESNYDANNIFIANNGNSAAFNDQLMYVTADEFFSRVTVAVAKEIANQLREYYEDPAHLEFPDAAALTVNSLSTGNCDSGQGPGRLPIECTGWPGIALMADATDPDTWYGQTIYTVLNGNQEVQLQFEGCAIVFSLNASFDFTYTPKKCVP